MLCPQCSNDYVDEQGVCHTCQTQTVPPKPKSAEIDRIKNVVASSLRADIENAITHIVNEQGDRGYWERQIAAPNKRLRELDNGKPFSLAEYCLDMTTV